MEVVEIVRILADVASNWNELRKFIYVSFSLQAPGNEHVLGGYSVR